MKKLNLPVIVLLTVMFFPPQKVNAQANLDCHGIFTKESNACLKESTECIDSCVEKGNAAMSLTVDGGKVMKECMRSICDPASKACNDKTKANFKACIDAWDAKKESAPEAKKETPVPTETGGWLNPRDLIYDYLIKEAARFEVRAPGYWEIKPEDFVISAGAPKPEGGNIWIVEPRTKVWVKAKDQNEYKPFDSNTIVGPGSYIKTETPVDFWVKGVGRVQLRPGSSGSGIFAVEEINGEISPFLLMGEMEIKYGKPKEEGTGKPIDWEQIKFKVRTPNSSTTVSRTHYLVKYDEKSQETTVAVLEGAVKVAPKIGKPVTVTPKDGKSGVAVVSQKFSPTKFAIAGLVLTAIIGGVVFLKRRGLRLSSPKKKSSR